MEHFICRWTCGFAQRDLLSLLCESQVALPCMSMPQLLASSCLICCVPACKRQQASLLISITILRSAAQISQMITLLQAALQEYILHLAATTPSKGLKCYFHA